MADLTKFQQKVVKNYYDNRETIALQRVQELVTDLYLAEDKKKREKVWDSLELHFAKLGVKEDTLAHLRKQNKPELVADLIQRILSKK